MSGSETKLSPGQNMRWLERDPLPTLIQYDRRAECLYAPRAMPLSTCSSVAEASSSLKLDSVPFNASAKSQSWYILKPTMYAGIISSIKGDQLCRSVNTGKPLSQSYNGNVQKSSVKEARESLLQAITDVKVGVVCFQGLGKSYAYQLQNSNSDSAGSWQIRPDS